jgi:hypothetical protein
MATRRRPTRLESVPAASSLPKNGVWIWQLDKIRQDYLDTLAALQCQVVYLKVFDDLRGPSFWANQCTSQLISRFNRKGIQVIGWGYHFDRHSSVDADASAREVAKAMACGLEGYVVDLEAEVENSATHENVGALLDALRGAVGSKLLGYTSFGHAGFHPGVPWTLLDQKCDAAFPQIYFEKWTFGASDEARVQACINAYRDAGLTKPMLPIWGSEEDTVRPASAETLQRYLNRFPGSSIFRVPNVGQKGQAWRLTYGGGFPMATIEAPATLPVWGPYTGPLRMGDSGARVKNLQRQLLVSGADPGPVDGDFGEMTRAAVKIFQLRAGLSPDGVVGPRTWTALGGTVPPATPPPNELAERVANFAEMEAARKLQWTGPDSEAEKYLRPLRAPMQALGHIGSQPVFFNWCAAFVTYCCRQVGIQVPDQPAGFWATMALVDSWKYWAQQNGTWLLPSTTPPRRGDIVCFEWHDGDVELDHIGIVKSYSEGSTIMETSEGNRGNLSVNGTRPLTSIGGLIRLSSI